MNGGWLWLNDGGRRWTQSSRNAALRFEWEHGDANGDGFVLCLRKLPSLAFALVLFAILGLRLLRRFDRVLTLAEQGAIKRLPKRLVKLIDRL